MGNAARALIAKVKARNGVSPDQPIAAPPVDRSGVDFIPDEAKPFEPTIGQKIARGPVGSLAENVLESSPARFAGGFAKDMGESLANIPRGVEAVGRAVPKFFAGPTKPGEESLLKGSLRKAGRVLGEAEEESFLPGTEQIPVPGADASIGEFVRGGEGLAGEVGFDPGVAGERGEIAAEIALIAPGAWSLLRGTLIGGAKLAGLSKTIVNGLKGAVRNRGAALQIRQRSIEALIDQMYRVKELGGKVEKEFFVQANTLGKKVEKYRLMRGRNYRADMKKALETFGKAKVKTADVVDDLRDISGDQNVPRSFQRWAETQIADLSGKETIDLKKMADLRREAMGKFAQFKNPEGLDRVRASAAAARQLSAKMNDSIKSGVREFATRNNIDLTKVENVIKVNDDYHKASVMLANTSKIVGPQRKVLEQGKLVRDFPGAERGVRRTATKGSEADAKVLDSFAQEFPESAESINELRQFMAADEIIGKLKAGAGITTTGGQGGTGGIIRASTEKVTQELPFQASKGLLGAIQKSKTQKIARPIDLSRAARGAGASSKLGDK